MNYDFITLGFNCVPALILKELGLRKYSLPFDWNITNNMQVINCIEHDFNKFHKNLSMILDGHWMIDECGIQYPHDYPVDENECIVDNWKDYYQDNVNKYNRRIERFKNILQNDKPIIAVYLGKFQWATIIHNYLCKKFNKRFIFIVGTYEKIKSKNSDLIVCNLTNNEESRNKDFWITSINEAISKIQNNNKDKNYPLTKINMKYF